MKFSPQFKLFYLLTSLIFLTNCYGAYVQMHIAKQHSSLVEKHGILLGKMINERGTNDKDINALLAIRQFNKTSTFTDDMIAKNAKVMIFLQLCSLLVLSLLCLYWRVGHKFTGKPKRP